MAYQLPELPERYFWKLRGTHMPGSKYIVLTYRNRFGFKHTVVQEMIIDRHNEYDVKRIVEKMMRQAFDKSYGDWVANIVTGFSK